MLQSGNILATLLAAVDSCKPASAASQSQDNNNNNNNPSSRDAPSFKGEAQIELGFRLRREVVPKPYLAPSPSGRLGPEKQKVARRLGKRDEGARLK